MATSTQLTEQQAAKGIMAYLGSPAAQSSLRAACAKGLTPERLLRVIGGALSRNRRLLECTKESLFISLANCAQLGLEPNLLGDAHLVPYKNKYTNSYECQMQVGYTGLLSLARRTGEIVSISAEVVHQKDKFHFVMGDNPAITHEPYEGDDDPGPVTQAYAIAVLKDGGRQRCRMFRREIEKVRQSSRAKDDGPWVQWYEEMAKKTVLRRLCKYLPKSVELIDALDHDSEGDAGDAPTFTVPSLPPTTDDTPTPTADGASTAPTQAPTAAADKLKQAVAAKADPAAVAAGKTAFTKAVEVFGIDTVMKHLKATGKSASATPAFITDAEFVCMAAPGAFDGCAPAEAK